VARLATGPRRSEQCSCAPTTKGGRQRVCADVQPVETRQGDLLYDKHYKEQVELVDLLAERIQTLGGVTIAMAHDVAETTNLSRLPRGRQDAPVQLSRLLHAHEVVLYEARTMARQASERGDDGTNDLIVSDVIRTNELQVWFLSEHLVDIPLVRED
jgi:starvation-inducible DNA-binding protein